LCINNDLSVLALFRDLLEDAGYQVSTQPYVTAIWTPSRRSNLI
jgi:hypothetical protein